MDEVFVKIGGRTHYLYRAVNEQGQILDIFLHHRRNQLAAMRFFRNVLGTSQQFPRVLATDKLRSYPTAQRQVFQSVGHHQHKGLNNVIENSHKRVRKLERYMQRFLSAFELIYEHAQPKRHKMTASNHRQERQSRFDQWQQLTSLG